MASRSSMPQSGPKAQAVSYSGPSPIPSNFGFFTFVARPQLMMQAKQPRGRVRSFSASDSPPILSASGKYDSLKFRVGKPPISLRIFTRTSVPYLRSPSPPTAFCLIFVLAFSVAFLNASLSFTCTAPVPRTATALRFFDPITEPTPVLPAARLHSFMMLAK